MQTLYAMKKADNQFLRWKRKHQDATEEGDNNKIEKMEIDTINAPPQEGQSVL